MVKANGSVVVLVLVGVFNGVAPDRVLAASGAGAVEPTERLAASAELVDRGRELYGRRCAACHGAEGKGDGEAAYLLYPKPRNFIRGQFRFVSTWEGAPTDEDIFRVVSRGIPGSAMPSWAHLSETDRWALVHFVKSISGPLSAEPPEPGSPEGLIEVPPEPPGGPASIALGKSLFATHCKACHGPLGRGDGPGAAVLVDDADFPIRPRDLNSGVLKGSPRPELLYRRIVAGIPGTPMFKPDLADPVECWHLVHFVLSLSSERLRERAEMKRFRIAVARVERLPDHPDAGEWRHATPVNLHLMPLWWRYKRPEYVTVQALHDGKELAILLTWADDSHDLAAIRPQDFRDGAAVQFATGPDEPFFAMGEKGRFINIWMWKSDREADLQGFHDIEWQYADIGIDSYPNLQRSPYEQPARHALTVDSDPTFITGWGAGNIVADPMRRSSAEDLRAQGFGTLHARPPVDQEVEALGVYDKGSYRVVFRRSLEPRGEGAVTFRPGTTMSVGFAIWNGSAGDRDGKKSVTIWQDLVIAE